jgi:hypothetical protein
MRWISQSSDWLAEGNSESDPLYQHQKVDQQRPRRGLLFRATQNLVQLTRRPQRRPRAWVELG